jgi:glycosyltransferase involved in cell wall biosynthesis
MSRPIIYDVTHLVCRMPARALTGIDRVDLAYGRHFAASGNADIAAGFCSASGLRVFGGDTLRGVVHGAERSSSEESALGDDANFARIMDWLNGEGAGKGGARRLASPRVGLAARVRAETWLARCRWRPANVAPRDAVYLNIAEHWLEFPRYFAWLDRRPDVAPVFFVHDLLPFDYPEFFRPDYDDVFERRFATVARYGTAFVVSTNVVRDRLREALAEHGKADAPVHVAPLPSPLARADTGTDRPEVPLHPYFILVSTIEPRKNHLLVLNVWRELAAVLGEDTPRLVLIGSRGWENEQVTDMLERCDGIAPYVLRTARISRDGLAWLMRHAQALLMPSFDEGYGLPLVEALSLGTPVVASDIATFREVCRGCACLLSPIDGPAWMDAVRALSARGSPGWANARAKAAPFRSPDWPGYFRRLDEFLKSL